MRGVVLAGGTGSRLLPLTKVTNKHLLPVQDKPMISYTIETVVIAGILDMLLGTGGKDAAEFLRLLGDAEIAADTCWKPLVALEGGFRQTVT